MSIRSFICMCLAALTCGAAQLQIAQAEVIPVRLPQAVVRIINTEAPAPAKIVDASPALEPAQAPSTGYVVKRGDTLSDIAKKFGISLSALMQANGIRNANKVFIGQRLSIPSTGGGGSLSPATQPLPARAPATGPKSILISLSKQRMFAYEGEKLVKTYLISTGTANRLTAMGNFRIKTKLPEAYASTWQLRMPWWMGFYDSGPLENGIHALPINRNGQTLWGGLLGRPASFGCVIMATADAAALYNWAPIGTPVIVRY